MSAADKYRKALQMVAKLASTCGANIFTTNYKMNWVTYLVITCITIYFLCGFYTIYIKISESWFIILEVLCMAGSVCQGTAKLISGIKYAKKIYATSQSLEEIYEHFVKRNLSYKLATDRVARKLENCVKATSAVYGALGFIVLTASFILLVTKQKVFIMQFFVPGLDPETNYGYYLTISTHATCFFFGLLGNFAGDIGFLLFIINNNLFIEILNVMLSDLDDSLDEPDNYEQSKKILNEICIWSQTQFEYMKDIKNTFFWVVTVQITTAAFSILLTMFICLVGSVFSAHYFYFVYLIYCTIILFLFCILGTQVEIMNDKTVDAFYNFNWYNLAVNDKKLLIIMLAKAQNPIILTIGELVPLSVNTGLQVMKTVYSYMMFLLNFLE